MYRLTLTEFPAIALGEFPELREEFEEFAGLPYVQMGTFARLLQKAKGRADWDLYARAASFAHRLWLEADSNLRNAINVSLLEHIDFEGPRGPHAWSLLSPELQRAWRAMAAYNKWIHSGAKGEPPPEADV